MLIYNHIPTAFPWYDKKEKQARYQDNCDVTCDYKLITPNNALLPFEFTRPTVLENIYTWRVYRSDDTEALVLTSIRSNIRSFIKDGKKTYYYNGSTIGQVLPPGFYYSVIEFNTGQFQFSEMFNVPFDSFALGAPNRFLQLEWYSTCSIEPFFYGDTVNGVPYFRNVAYLDTFVQGDEPEIQEETEQDGDGSEFPIFQRCVIRYRIPHAVAGYLKTALVIMQMHDMITLTTKFGVESGQISRVSTTTSPLDNGCLSNIDILFEQELAIVKRSCC